MAYSHNDYIDKNKKVEADEPTLKVGDWIINTTHYKPKPYQHKLEYSIGSHSPKLGLEWTPSELSIRD